MIADEIDKVDSVPDIMTTSMYQKNGNVAADNGGRGHMNGAEVVGHVEVAGVDAIAGTSLKCLEEPSFEFEASNETTNTAKPTSVSAAASAATNFEAGGQPPSKKPSYRVLEDPFESAAPGGGAVVAQPNKRSPNYRVLEDPMTTAMYEPSTSSDATGASPSAAVTAATLSNRPAASEVLEGAREKFDKFWGASSSKKASSNPAAAATSSEAAAANNEP